MVKIEGNVLRVEKAYKLYLKKSVNRKTFAQIKVADCMKGLYIDDPKESHWTRSLRLKELTFEKGTPLDLMNLSI